MARRNPIIRLFQGIWWLLGLLRRVIQVLLLLFVVAIIVVAITGQPVRVPDSAALVINPSGLLVEQLEGDPVSRAFAELQGGPLREALVKDLKDALAAAATDERIRVVVLSLADFDGGGLTKLEEVGQAIQDLRRSGKKVIAMGDAYTQAQYYLAAQADEVYMHPLGSILLDGFGYYRAYFRDALDKLSIDVNVFRVGEYKSFVEPFTRDSMSPEDQESSRRWLTALWDGYKVDVAAARDLEPPAVAAYAEQLADLAEAAGGNLARVALEAGLVDELMGRREFDDYLVELVGQSDEEYDGWNAIDYGMYLKAVRREQSEARAEHNVGVLVAAGEIVDGEAPPGTIGGDTLARLVRQAAEDESIDALVLRVDSPGGSMFASEVVFEELQALRDAGKPLMVSMGSVAASGGYYIAMPAAKIFSAASTITGSIGVGALIPTFQRGLERLGVRVDGIGTTRLSGQLQPERELGADARRLLQASVDDAYRVFVGKVADSRDMTAERADNLARGRVWIGADALDLGLVDEIGDLDDAIAAAAAAAGLPEDDYGIRYVEQPLDFREQLAMEMAGKARLLMRALGLSAMLPRTTSLDRLLDSLGRDLARLERFNDPRGLYYLCFCVPD